MRYDLGFIDSERKTLQPLDNPFGPGLSPMSQVRSVTHLSGPDRQACGGWGVSRTHVHHRSLAFGKLLVPLLF
jgi:hypothetical protein